MVCQSFLTGVDAEGQFVAVRSASLIVLYMNGDQVAARVLGRAVQRQVTSLNVMVIVTLGVVMVMMSPLFRTSVPELRYFFWANPKTSILVLFIEFYYILQ